MPPTLSCAAYGAYNIGITHWRPTAVAKTFAAEWMRLLLSDNNIWDQNGFNDLMRKNLGPEANHSSGLFYSFDGTLKLGILPVSVFCSGHTFFVQASSECVLPSFICVVLSFEETVSEYVDRLTTVW